MMLMHFHFFENIFSMCTISDDGYFGRALDNFKNLQFPKYLFAQLHFARPLSHHPSLQVPNLLHLSQR